MKKLILHIFLIIVTSVPAFAKNVMVSGTVTGADGVTVTLSGSDSGSQVVNSGGSYSFTVAEGGTYIITPSKSGYSFSPESAAFENVTSDETQDFTATQNIHIISGTVTGNGQVNFHRKMRT